MRELSKFTSSIFSQSAVVKTLRNKIKLNFQTMSAKKGFELLKNLSKFFSESNGFDKVLKDVSQVHKIKIKTVLK